MKTYSLLIIVFIIVSCGQKPSENQIIIGGSDIFFNHNAEFTEQRLSKEIYDDYTQVRSATCDELSSPLHKYFRSKDSEIFIGITGSDTELCKKKKVNLRINDKFVYSHIIKHNNSGYYLIFRSSDSIIVHKYFSNDSLVKKIEFSK
ncbi:MAG: hypothetical protein WC313_06790 [Candidatus Kapaibacterium sp.]|jgi:hypothetical protein|nr:hypothetical protein [Candidatus Kapabacteria bacterium]